MTERPCPGRDREVPGGRSHGLAGSESGAGLGRARYRTGSGVPGPGRAGLGRRIGPVGPGSLLG